MTKKLDQDTKVFLQKVRKYKTLKVQKENIEADMQDLKEDILNYLEESGQSEYIGNNVSVKYMERTRRILDKDRITSILGSDLSEYEKPISYIQLYIK